MILSDEQWLAKGVIEADADRAFESIVEYFNHHILPALQRAAPDRPGEEHSVIDMATRTIRFHGNWWYGATISVSIQDAHACLVTYKVNNIAKGTRTIAFIAHRNVPKETRITLRKMLNEIGAKLNCYTHLVP